MDYADKYNIVLYVHGLCGLPNVERVDHNVYSYKPGFDRSQGT